MTSPRGLKDASVMPHGRCDWFRERISEYIDRELATEDAQTMDTHLEACHSCLVAMQRIEATSSVLKNWDADVNRSKVPGTRIERGVMSRTAVFGRQRRRARRKLWQWRGALAVLVLFTLGGSVLLGSRPRGASIDPIDADVYESSRGEIARAPTGGKPELQRGPASHALLKLQSRVVAFREDAHADRSKGLFGSRQVMDPLRLPSYVASSSFEFEIPTTGYGEGWKAFDPFDGPHPLLVAAEARRRDTDALAHKLGLDPARTQWVSVVMRDGVMLATALDAADHYVGAGDWAATTTNAFSRTYVTKRAWDRMMRNPSLRARVLALSGAQVASQRPATSRESFPPHRSGSSELEDGEVLVDEQGESLSLDAFWRGITDLERWVAAARKGETIPPAAALKRLTPISVGSGTHIVALPMTAVAQQRDRSERFLDPLVLQTQGKLRWREGSSIEHVVALVGPTNVPTYIPAGQFLSGGETDRCVAVPVVIPATPSAQPYLIQCVAVRSGVARDASEHPIQLEEGIAGPTMRRLLAQRADATQIDAWVRWVVDVAYRSSGQRAPALGGSLLDLSRVLKVKMAGKRVPYAKFSATNLSAREKLFARSQIAGLAVFRPLNDMYFEAARSKTSTDTDLSSLSGIDLVQMSGPYRSRLLARWSVSIELEHVLHGFARVFRLDPPEVPASAIKSATPASPSNWTALWASPPALHRQRGVNRVRSHTVGTFVNAARGSSKGPEASKVRNDVAASFASHATLYGSTPVSLQLFAR